MPLCLRSAGLLAGCLALNLSSHKGHLEHLVPQFHCSQVKDLSGDTTFIQVAAPSQVQSSPAPSAPEMGTGRPRSLAHVLAQGLCGH